jgi:hypothetical protein
MPLFTCKLANSMGKGKICKVKIVPTNVLKSGRLVQSVELGTDQFAGWFNPGCTLVWLNRIFFFHLFILPFYLLFSSIMVESIEP